MRILDVGTKQLTNAELLDHFQHQRAQWSTIQSEAEARNGTIRSRPKNLDAITNSVKSRLLRPEAPTPHVGEAAYDATVAIPLLCKRLKPYRLTKPELLQIFNLRPWMLMQMASIIEDFETRFSEKQQREMVLIIYEVLGGESYPVFEEEAEVPDSDIHMDGT
ncbi:MAG: hypothetical protein M1822_009163 [Bathelium mastoideum]|nr:MAG: hypothetical protein M1822_009163 [Bathelium mastoideum]